MGLILKKTGTVFEGQACGPDQSALYPGVCALPSGRLIVTFRTASHREATAEQKLVMCFSDDKGETWSKPHEFFRQAPKVEDRCGEFFLMYITPVGGSELLGTLIWVDASKPDRPYYNPETHGIIDHNIFFAKSHNHGDNWEKPYPLQMMPHSRPAAVTSPTLLLPDGKLACQFEVHKHYDEVGPMFFEGALMFSEDGGELWSDYKIVSKDPKMRFFWWDQRINVVGKKLLGLFWTYDDKESAYLNIHAAQSMDCGATWGEHYDTGVPGQPSQPVGLTDGSLAMAYVDRTTAPAIRVRQSVDGGRTWPRDTEVTVYDSGLETQVNKKDGLNDMWTEIYQFSVGFPGVAVMPDGDLIVCYYAGTHTDCTSIKWALLGQ